MGLKITKVHRVLEFDQSPWMKGYIDLNTDKRKQATNDFDERKFQINEQLCFWINYGKYSKSY